MALKAIAACLFGKFDSVETWSCEPKDEYLASKIVESLYNSEKKGKQLKYMLRNSVDESSWSESLAEAILNAMDACVREARAMSPAVKEAFDRATEAAINVGNFATDHPVFCTVIALGILVILMPWVIELLGFAAEGPIEGESLYPTFSGSY